MYINIGDHLVALSSGVEHTMESDGSIAGKHGAAPVPATGSSLLRRLVQGGDERALTAFFARSPRLMRELLDEAGYVEASSTPYATRGTNVDIECANPGGTVVLVEFAFRLTLGHMWKDFRYIPDALRADRPPAAIIWVCDEIAPAAAESIAYYGRWLRTVHSFTVAVLRPRRICAEPPELRFDLIAAYPPKGAGRSVPSSPTDLRSAIAAAAAGDRIEAPSLASVLGTSVSWMTRRAGADLKNGRPRLEYLRGENGEPVPGTARCRVFAVEQVLNWTRSFELFVQARHGFHSPVPMLSGADRRVGAELVQLTDAAHCSGRRRTSEILRRKLAPVAFCVAAGDQGYSLLYPRDAVAALPPMRAAPKKPIVAAGSVAQVAGR